VLMMQFTVCNSVTTVFDRVSEVERDGDTTFTECVEVCFCVPGDTAFCDAENVYLSCGGQVSRQSMVR